jgi:hypothetical protein
MADYVSRFNAGELKFKRGDRVLVDGNNRRRGRLARVTSISWSGNYRIVFDGKSPLRWEERLEHEMEHYDVVRQLASLDGPSSAIMRRSKRSP